MRNLTLAIIATLLLAIPAAAQTTMVAGNVWQVNGQGVYIQNSNGITFVAANQAQFYTNGVPVDYRYVAVGQPVNAYANSIIRQGNAGYANGPNFHPRNNWSRRPHANNRRDRDRRWGR